MPEELPAVTERDVYITRAFAAPRETVWEFWTRPDLIAQWFGPEGFSVPIDSVKIDLHVGGSWNLSMRDDATGDLFPISGTITACDPPEYLEVRLSARTGAEIADLDDVMLRVQFHDHGEKTRVTLHQGPFDPVQRDMTAGGWELSFVKMDRIFSSDESSTNAGENA